MSLSRSDPGCGLAYIRAKHLFGAAYRGRACVGGGGGEGLSETGESRTRPKGPRHGDLSNGEKRQAVDGSHGGDVP
jgi:hypothetical protein